MKINKRKAKKLLAFILSLAIFINFMLMIFKPNIVNAAIDYNNGGPVDSLATGIGSLLSGLVLVIASTVIKLPVLLIGYLLKILMNSIVFIGTGTFSGDISLENILFAGYSNNTTGFKTIEVTDVNFFNFGAGDTIVAFREAVAKWYYIMRLISAAILLVILIYVGIRMAISTIASEQAKYKQMLIDWATSLALLFLLHYIILFVIQINSTLVNSLGSLVKLSANGKTLGNALNDEIVKDVWLSATSGLIAAIVYCVIQGMVFRYFLFYLKRMITVGFLIIIAPLITITYSIDKMGDGKAQALNAWLKELVYNILIQPFHCVLYLAFFGAIQAMLGEQFVATNLLPYVLTVVILTFMPKAEEILRKIFHFEANSMPSVNEPAQGFMNATGRFAKMGMNAGRAVSNFRAAGGMKALTGGFAEMKAKRQIKRDFNAGNIKDSNGESLNKNTKFSDYMTTTDYSNRMTEYKTNADEQKRKKQEKRNNKARRIYENRYPDTNFDEMVEQEAKKAYKKENPNGDYDKLTSEEKEKYRSPIREKLTSQTLATGTKARRTLTGVKKVGSTIGKAGSKVWEAGKEFSNMRVGKAVIGLTKDSFKVASAIAFGASAYGVTGQMNDAMSMGQLGYGLSTGILESTTRTLEKDSGAAFTQLAINMGIPPEQMKQFCENMANTIKASDIGGKYKQLGDQINKMQQTLEKTLGDKVGEFMTQLQIKSANGEIYSMDDELQNYINQQDNLNLTDDEKKDAKEELIRFSNLVNEATLAGLYSKLESTTGMDEDSWGRRSSKYVKNETINNYYDQRNTTNNTINNNINNSNGGNPPNPNNGGASNP